MTPLRQRMLDAMTVRGLVERTKECYTDAVARLARHYHRSPDLLNPAEFEAYLHKLRQGRLALPMPSLNPNAAESTQAFMARVARLEVMTWLHGQRHGELALHLTRCWEASCANVSLGGTHRVTPVQQS